MKTLKIALIVSLILIALAGIAHALPVEIESVEIDDISLTPDAENRLDLERGEQYEVEVRFTALANIDDMEVEVFISGYEYNDVERISDHVPIFDADANVTYVKRLDIYIPDEVEEDDYKLRVILTDRNGDELIQRYNLKLDVPRHALKIEDIFLTPEGAIKAGSALLATVRLENKGEKDEEDIKVTVAIPELNLAGVEYIDEIENNDEEEETEEIFIRIPRSAKGGTYDLIVEVEFSEKHRTVTGRRTITILEDETYSEDQQPKTTITLGSQTGDSLQGGSAIFPITITNTGRTSKVYTLNIPPADWATITVTPTNTLVVDKASTQTIYVNVKVNEDAPTGAHSIVASLNSGSETVQQLSFITNVSESTSHTSARDVFEVILVVLVILLIILGIVIGVSRLRSGGQAQTYY